MARYSTARLCLLLLLYAFPWIPGMMAKKSKYHTNYACDNETLKIECEEDGEFIKIIRANYGRFSLAICNRDGNPELGSDCNSGPSSKEKLNDRCNRSRNCSLFVGTAMFGEPCPGTPKYLEVQYLCLPVPNVTTTNRPSPSWLITSQPPSVWSTVKPTARPTPPPPKISIAPPSRPSTPVSTSTQTTPPSQPPFPQNVEADLNGSQEETDRPFREDSLPDEITTLPFSTIMPKKTKESTVTYKYKPSPSIPPPRIKDNDVKNYCKPTNARGLYWNWTQIETINVQPCPDGTTGVARWRCSFIDVEPQWFPQNPDLSECKLPWLTNLDSRISKNEPPSSIASDLSQVTKSKTLYGGDMDITTKIMRKMADKMSKDQGNDKTTRTTVELAEILENVAKTGSNLLDPSHHPCWWDLNSKERMRVATSLLIGLEQYAFLLANTVTREKTIDQSAKNIMLSVRVLKTENIAEQVFPSDKSMRISNDTIQLPRGALEKNSEGRLVRLVFVAFDHLEEILKWQPDLAVDSYGRQPNVTKVLNSQIISASLGEGRHIQLSEPVQLTLKHLRVENVSNPSCVFWDYTTSTWSEEGCWVLRTNYSHTVCQCNHLTNFAILMDVHSTYLPAAHEMALQIITYVGCIVSIICLVLAIITFQLFRAVKSDRTTIHSNLCVCLLIAELLFLVGIDQTENKILCGAVAILLHYFFLCAFVWMFFEGFQLYVMLIEVFEAEKSRIRWYYFIAYGLPLLIVAISGAIDPFSYGTQLYCWLRPDNYFIYSFVGPVIVVIALNLIFLGMAIVLMCRHANATVSMKNKEHSRLASASTWLRGAIVLVFLLGLTWTFGLLYLNMETVVMAYIFAILNSLQGFFIFVFHCVQNEKVRKEYRKFIRRHSWLPKCLRCSKPNGSAASASSSSSNKERRTSLYAGSNGNPSAPNSHSTDNSVLSPHGTSVGTNNIVISNNLNNMTNVRPTALVQVLNRTDLNHHNNSYSRDSGHGGSEQEDSPRSHAVTGAPNARLNNHPKDTRRQPYMSQVDYQQQQQLQQQQQQDDFQEYVHRGELIPHPKHLQLPQCVEAQGAPSHVGGSRKKNGSFLRSASPWNHTYTEIHEAQGRGMYQRRMMDDDPVYEEIERNEIQVSDMSDEDGRRQSDMSRQSSRSYGDHRLLIPYSPATDRNIHSCLEAVTKHRNKERYACDLVTMIRQNIYRGDTARSLAAVLDGETVVCHLEPPEMYHRDS